MRGKQKYGMTLSEARRAREKEKEEREEAKKKRYRIRTTGSKTPDEVQKASRSTAAAKRGLSGGRKAAQQETAAARAITPKASPITPTGGRKAAQKRTAAKRKSTTSMASYVPLGGRKPSPGKQGFGQRRSRAAAKRKSTTSMASNLSQPGAILGKPLSTPKAPSTPSETSFRQAFADARKKKGAGGVFTWNKKKYTTNYEAEQAEIDRAKKRKDKKDALSGNKEARSRVRRTRGSMYGR